MLEMFGLVSWCLFSVKIHAVNELTKDTTQLFHKGKGTRAGSGWCLASRRSLLPLDVSRLSTPESRRVALEWLLGNLSAACERIWCGMPGGEELLFVPLFRKASGARFVIRYFFRSVPACFCSLFFFSFPRCASGSSSSAFRKTISQQTSAHTCPVSHSFWYDFVFNILSLSSAPGSESASVDYLVTAFLPAAVCRMSDSGWNPRSRDKGLTRTDNKAEYAASVDGHSIDSLSHEPQRRIPG